MAMILQLRYAIDYKKLQQRIKASNNLSNYLSLWPSRSGEERPRLNSSQAEEGPINTYIGRGLRFVILFN